MSNDLIVRNVMTNELQHTAMSVVDRFKNQFDQALAEGKVAIKSVNVYTSYGSNHERVTMTLFDKVTVEVSIND